MCLFTSCELRLWRLASVLLTGQDDGRRLVVVQEKTTTNKTPFAHESLRSDTAGVNWLPLLHTLSPYLTWNASLSIVCSASCTVFFTSATLAPQITTTTAPVSYRRRVAPHILVAGIGGVLFRRALRRAEPAHTGCISLALPPLC